MRTLFFTGRQDALAGSTQSGRPAEQCHAAVEVS